MKKAVLFILLLIIPVVSVADVDLSDMSFDELVSLRDQLNLAIWNSQKWQKVKVPIGVWEVGKDIPVGHWSISVDPDTKSDWGTVIYCSELDASGKKAGNMFTTKIYYREHINHPDKDDGTEPLIIDIDCLDGTYIVIEHAQMVFTPYAGKPDLGFK